MRVSARLLSRGSFFGIGIVLQKEQSPALADQALEFWQARTSRKLTKEDARQMTESIVKYFQTLHRWYLAEQRSSFQNQTQFEKGVHPNE